MWDHGRVSRMTRQDAKALTRERILEQAQRLFRERGYAATSLEQVAEAAQVTKGAIYGHFSSKEDLLLSAVEASPPPAWTAGLNDASRPPRERLTQAVGAITADEWFNDKAALAVQLEFLAALLRSPAALARYGAEIRRRLEELAAADADPPLPGTSQVQSWAIGDALLTGLRVYQFIAPDLITPEVFSRTFEALNGMDGAGPAAPGGRQEEDRT